MIVLFALPSIYGDLIAAGLARAYQESNKPMIFICWDWIEEHRTYFEIFRQSGMAVFDEVDHAVRALGKYVAYAQRMAVKRSPVQETLFMATPSKAEVTSLFADHQGRMLSEYQTKNVLKVYGISTTREELAASPREAVEIAESLGYPVALKIASPDLAHKTEVGGVKLNLQSATEVEAAYTELMTKVAGLQPGVSLQGILVQEMLTEGVELIVGLNRDAVFGPVLMFGLGGIFVEALADISLRVLPITAQDAMEMVQEIRGFQILKGIRGKAGADLDAIYEILLKVSQLVLDFPDEIRELDLNPIIVFPEGKGAKVVDALIALK
jgi:acetyltransferase